MESNIELWKNNFYEIKKAIEDNTKYHVDGTFSTSFAPNLQYIKIDTLDETDWPNGISNNSVYFLFAFYFDNNKMELKSCGHVYLSPKDLKTEKYKYLAMKSIVNVAVDKGGKKFKKQSFKTNEQAANKILSYVNEVMEYVKEYTGGYPYKRGVEE